MGVRSGVYVIFIIVGLSALLVSTKRGNSRALTREASDRDWLHVFFVYVRFILIYCILHCGSLVIFNVMMLMEKVYGYEAPVVEIIEVEVEKGFAASTEDLGGY